MTDESRLEAVEREQRAFDAMLDAMLVEHAGDFTVFHGGEPIGYFENLMAAYKAALDRFGPREPFLLSEVKPRSDAPISLAWELGVMFGA